ncbi:MAG: TRAFs-binding domain-containing protein, partial [Planctomycetota bacterium]
RRLDAVGAPALMHDVAFEGVEKLGMPVELRQLDALALRRLGAFERAEQTLLALIDEGHQNEEIFGLMAAVEKALWRESSGSSRQHHLRRAIALYEQAYEATGGYWTGINAASLSAAYGSFEDAHAVARRVLERCESGLEGEVPKNELYWLLATAAEACWVLGRVETAIEWYERAGAALGGRHGHRASTLRNARMLIEEGVPEALEAEAQEELFDRVRKALGTPTVAVFSGHMVDQPGRRVPRFPAAIEAAVAKAIRGKLDELDVGIGYASAAAGGDILFHEALIERGAESNVILPYPADMFVPDSVKQVGERWEKRFFKLAGRAAELRTVAKERLAFGSVSFEYADRFLHGLATMRARELLARLRPIALWDGRPGDGPGGTASNVERWRSAGIEVTVVDINELRETMEIEVRAADASGADAAPSMEPSRAEAGVPTLEESKASRAAASVALGSRILSIVFVDAKGFSKLLDAEIPFFVHHALGAIAQVMKEAPTPPSIIEPRGDGYYIVFDEVEAAGQFGLLLSNRLHRTGWSELGLPQGLAFRVALHAGPVFAFSDPVTGLPTYTGAHVVKAARIEPVTPPGQVYASEAFAALASGEDAKGFAFEYVGRVPLAKSYGSAPLYRVIHA